MLNCVHTISERLTIRFGEDRHINEMVKEDSLQEWLANENVLLDYFADIIVGIGQKAIDVSPAILLRNTEKVIESRSAANEMEKISNLDESLSGTLVFKQQLEEETMQRLTQSQVDLDQLDAKAMAQISHAVDKLSLYLNSIRQEVKGIPGLFELEEQRLSLIRQLNEEAQFVKTQFDNNTQAFDTYINGENIQ